VPPRARDDGFSGVRLGSLGPEDPGAPLATERKPTRVAGVTLWTISGARMQCGPA